MHAQNTPLPERITLKEKEADCLLILYRWFREIHLFMFFFALLWNALLFFFYFNAKSLTETSTFFWIFPFLHLLIGLGLLYYATAGILNKTVLEVRPSGLRIRHRPLFWIGERHIRRNDLIQLFVHESVSSSSSGTLITYQLRALIGKKTRSVTLVKGLESPDQARFIERFIEDYLHIQDYPVEGEYPKEQASK